MQPKRHSPEGRTIALPQGHHVMIGAAGPQVGGALVTRHEIEPPDRGIEVLRTAEVRRFEIDAAQGGDGKMGHSAASSSGASRGRMIWIFVPAPGLVSSWIRPPRRLVTMLWTMCNPRPVEP